MKIGIAGLGLIGGSLALALKKDHDVTGFDVDRGAREAMGRAGVRVVTELTALLPADAVIVATPLRGILTTLAALADHAGGAVLLDVGSIRGPVDAFARHDGHRARIVGLHPMAGRTTQGHGSADAALFVDRPFLVVPTERSDSEAMAIAGDIARAAGGVVTVCSAAEHDRIVAVLSALPLALGAALSVAGADAVPDLAAFAGPGYRDATRLALTPLDLAEAMLTANRANVVAALARMRTILDELERAIAEGDSAGVREILVRAAQARAALG